MGGMANLKIDLLPELQSDRVRKIRYWIEGFIYTHKLFPVSFLPLLLRGAILALDAIPSLTTLPESRSLVHDTDASRYLHRGIWSKEITPPSFRRPDGANFVHTLLSALEASTPSSLSSGIFALRYSSIVYSYLSYITYGLLATSSRRKLRLMYRFCAMSWICSAKTSSFLSSASAMDEIYTA